MQIPRLRVPLPEDDARQALTRLIASLAAESSALADLMENRRRAPADPGGAAETERLLQSAARLQMVLELLLAQAGEMLAREENGE